MNAVQVHLAINHLPIIGVLLTALLLAWGLLRSSREVLRAALGLTVLLAIVTYPVVLSGESAEEVVEDTVWASETRIHEHEERGEKALIAMLVTGALAAVGLWRLRGQGELDRVVPGIVLAALLVSSGMLGWTALAGGEIRHDELRAGSSTTVDRAGSATEEDEERNR